MSSRLVAVTLDATDPAGQAAFWGHLLGRDAVADADGVLLPGDETQVGLRFVGSATAASGPARMHLHLTTTGAAEQERTVAAVLRRGGRHLDVGQRPEEGHVVLADPGGDAFCVIEPGNGFLAGCGHLGEVACDGGRDVGVFWSEVLGWPLVWDQDGETAVQSPRGGTKLAWGGPPVAPKDGRNRQRLHLVAGDDDDVEAEVARLVGLGATRLHDLPPGAGGGVELADPEGNELRLGAGPLGWRG